MAGNYYLSLVSGIKTFVKAIQTSAGVGDAGKIPALDSSGKLDSSMMPVGIGSEVDVIPASENLSAGDLVNIYTNAGVSNVRKADASVAGKEANGFVLAAVASGSNATVYRSSQSNTQRTALTPGATYYLNTTAGGVTIDVSGFVAGNVIQSVGKAINATILSFDPGDVYILS